MKQLFTKSIIFIFIIIISLAIISRYVNDENNSSQLLKTGKVIDGNFEAVNHLGNKFTNESWKGKYKLIFFGFTSCPVICPSELTKISQIMDMLPENMAGKIMPVFITVDPERDNVEKLKDYIEMFHKDFTALTGSREQIDRLIKLFSVYAKKVEIKEMDTYMYDHSTFIYFLNDKDEILALYKMHEKSKDIAKDIETRISGN